MGISAKKNPRWADENTCIHQIAEWICRTAVIDGADIGWAGLHFWAEKEVLKLDFDRRISASIHNHHH